MLALLLLAGPALADELESAATDAGHSAPASGLAPDEIAFGPTALDAYSYVLIARPDISSSTVQICGLRIGYITRRDPGRGTSAIESALAKFAPFGAHQGWANNQTPRPLRGAARVGRRRSFTTTAATAGALAQQSLVLLALGSEAFGYRAKTRGPGIFYRHVS